MQGKGVVVAGHEVTAEAAQVVLAEGGNAFDAAIAAFFAACIAEPILASLGGGGFLLARTPSHKVRVFDFFVQTPLVSRSDGSVDFRPIVADFGTTQQEFHIGYGSAAVPGVVRGILEVHRQLGFMPLREIVQLALHKARQGVSVNAFQAYLLEIVSPIIRSSASAKQCFGGSGKTGLAREGDVLQLEALVETIEALAFEGDELFYQGEIAKNITEQCRLGGGHLGRKDLQDYQVYVREPLEVCYRDSQLFTNPPPSSGGLLIAFALRLLEKLCTELPAFGSFQHLSALARVMDCTNKARLDHLGKCKVDRQQMEALLDEGSLRRYREEILGRATALRGTTHIGVIDSKGNVAGLSISNGEGCGHIVPGTGIMLNNMLGEQDLNPAGFQQWTPNQRMTSMMSPSLLVDGAGRLLVTGSGGSNRIRTAIFQVLVNLLDYRMLIKSAVESPRIHYENNECNIEGGFEPSVIEQLIEGCENHRVWEDINLYFGGAHTAAWDGQRFDGAGDPRRGGVCVLA